MKLNKFHKTNIGPTNFEDLRKIPDFTNFMHNGIIE